MLVRDAYDDCGISGATLERPGLKQLLADIEEGLVDVVVVYKIDRLSRSLADFAKLGFIRESAVTAASAAGGRQLRRLVSPENTGSEAWADSAYRSRTNEKWLAARMLTRRIHHRKPAGRPMPRHTARANAEKRLAEACAILARGVIRLRLRNARPEPATGESFAYTNRPTDAVMRTPTHEVDA